MYRTTITRILWAALSGCMGIIILMASAWAHDTNERAIRMDERVNINEQHYAAIESDLRDLREHVREVKDILREQALQRVR